MIEIVLFGLACVATATALLPLLRREGVRGAFFDEGAEDLFIEKERVYASIKDLDFDHDVGKIESEDYQTMRRVLKREASAILDRIDQLKGGSQRAVLEREIARHRKGTVATDKGCPECGTAVTAKDRFCPGCGHKLG